MVTLASRDGFVAPSPVLPNWNLAIPRRTGRRQLSVDPASPNIPHARVKLLGCNESASMAYL